MVYPKGLFWVHYCLYVNDVITTTSLFDIILFADATTLMYSHPDISSKINLINKELSEISNRFEANKLSVNASKTNYKMLGTSHITYTTLIHIHL